MTQHMCLPVLRVCKALVAVENIKQAWICGFVAVVVPVVVVVGVALVMVVVVIADWFVALAMVVTLQTMIVKRRVQ